MMKKILNRTVILRNVFDKTIEESGSDPSTRQARSHAQDDERNDKRLRAVGGILVSALAVFYLVLSGCSMPAAPTHSNPADPDNPDFTGPGVEIITPTEGSSIASGTATIHLHGSGVAYEYSYKLDNAADWYTPWSRDTILTIPNMKEGPHTIQAIARDQGGYLGTATAIRNFTINQYANTVLMYPPAQTVAVGESAEVWCELEDMATPISAVRLLIYMSNYSMVDTAGARADTGYHWAVNGGTPVGPLFSYYGLNYIDVSLGVAGGSPSGVSGSGRIFKIRAETIYAGNMYMYINTIEARDTLNNPVTTTNQYQSAYIYVTSGKEGGK